MPLDESHTVNAEIQRIQKVKASTDVKLIYNVRTSMKTAILTCVSVCVLIFSGCTTMKQHSVAPGKQESLTMKKTISKTLELNYLAYLPDSYGENDKKWPVMVFLHGAGERGKDLERVKFHGPPKLVDNGQDFPFILISPQCPEGEWWPEKLEELNLLLDTVIDNYNVDSTRIYLTGLSMGGYGSWAWSIKNPERFAAVVPICGAGQPWQVSVLKDVPVWAFHGAKDTVVPVEGSKDMVAALTRTGGNVKLTIYPEATHDSWTETYNNMPLYDWILGNRKQ